MNQITIMTGTSVAELRSRANSRGVHRVDGGRIHSERFGCLQIILRQAGVLHDLMLRAGLECLVSVDRNNHGRMTLLRLAMVAATNPRTHPAMAFQDSAHLLPGYGFHTSTSSTRAFSGTGDSGTSR